MEKPTGKKIIKLLAANPQDQSEWNSFDHFKRYIKSPDELFEGVSSVYHR